MSEKKDGAPPAGKKPAGGSSVPRPGSLEASKALGTAGRAKAAGKDPLGSALNSAAKNIPRQTNAAGKRTVVGTGVNLGKAAASGAAGTSKVGKAVGGGAQGALAGAAVSALSKDNRRKLLLPLMFSPIGIFLGAVFLVILMISTISFSGVKDNAGVAGQSVDAAQKSGLSTTDYEYLVDGAERNDVPWQIMASIWQYEQQASATASCSSTLGTIANPNGASVWGDSVALSAKGELTKGFGDVDMNAADKQTSAIVLAGALKAATDNDIDQNTVVIATGNYGPVDAAQLKATLDALKSKKVILVIPRTGEDKFQAGVTTSLTEGAKGRDDVTIVNWFDVSKDHVADWLKPKSPNLTAAGITAYSAMIDKAGGDDTPAPSPTASPAATPPVTSPATPPADENGGAAGDSDCTDGSAAAYSGPAGAFRYPFIGPYRTTSDFGMRTNPGRYALGIRRLHAGIDLAGPNKTLVAATAGKVKKQFNEPTGGGNILVQDIGGGVELWYQHLSSFSVKVGDTLWPGRPLGIEGATGNVSGVHLHLGVFVNKKPVEPRAWFAARGVKLPAKGSSATGPAAALKPPSGTAAPAPADPATPADPAAPADPATPADYPDAGTVDGPGDTTNSTEGAYITKWNIPSEGMSKAEQDELKASPTKSLDWVAKRLRASSQQPDSKNHLDMSTGQDVDPSDSTRYFVDPTDKSAIAVASAWSKSITETELRGLNDDSTSRPVYATALSWFLGNKIDQTTTSGDSMVCAPPGGATLTVSSTGQGGTLQLSTKMLGYAAAIVTAGKEQKVTQNGQLIALMVALQESTMNMYANSKVGASLGIPHDRVGHDGLSVGLFQQQAGFGWGTVAEDMDPYKSALAFYGKLPGQTSKGLLQKVPNYDSMNKGQAAQAVQISKFPLAYDQWADAANTIWGKVNGISCSGAQNSGSNGIVGDPGQYKTFKPPAGGCTACVTKAVQMIGLPYSWGGGNGQGPSTGIYSSPSLNGTKTVGFDCSGLTSYSWFQGSGTSLPRTASMQRRLLAKAGRLTMDLTKLKPGDMVFFHAEAGGGAGHVGIFMGNGLVVHAPKPGSKVEVKPLDYLVKYDAPFGGGGSPPGYQEGSK